MNKKLIAIILSLILIFGAVMLISGCNKDDDTIIPNESTDAISETEHTTEEPSAEEPESSTNEEKTEKPTESTSKPDESETESPTKPTETTTKTTTDNDEPATCDSCGGIITDLSSTGDTLIGNYCDGNCDEWF